MISIDRCREVGEYANKYGADVAMEKYSLTEDTFNRYIRLYRKQIAQVPQSPKDVTTVQDALMFGNTDAFPGLNIQSVKVNTWGKEGNENKQVTVKLLPSESKLDTKAILEDFKKEIETYKVPPSKLYIPPTKIGTVDNHQLIIALPDTHFALLSWEKETGNNYDLTIARERTMSAVERLINGTGAFLGKILLCLNGDILNSDGISGATTGGTPQSNDSRWQKAFSETWKSLRDVIELCKTKADVEVVITSGNHDQQSAYYLGEVLSAWYKEDRHVVIDNTPMHYKYKQYGTFMAGITHGDGAKADKLPLIMAVDSPKMWSETTHRVFLTGHFHISSSKQHLFTTDVEMEHPGCTVIGCPALSSASHWTVYKGYRSMPEAQAYLIHPVKGRVATYHYRVN